MIRVTYNGGMVWECISIMPKSKEALVIVNSFYQCINLYLENIIKIEKQVKDLTKDEIYEYTMMKYGTGISNADIWADCIVVSLIKELDVILYNDDYVDVTDLYKEVE